MVKVTEAEKVLVKELNDFVAKYRKEISIFQSGFKFATTALKVEDKSRIYQEIGALYEAVNLYIKIYNDRVYIKYDVPGTRETISYWENSDNELTERQLCGILMKYQRNIENIIIFLKTKSQSSLFLGNMNDELNNILSKYFSI